MCNLQVLHDHPRIAEVVDPLIREIFRLLAEATAGWICTVRRSGSGPELDP